MRTIVVSIRRLCKLRFIRVKSEPIGQEYSNVFSEHVKVVFGHVRRLVIEELPSTSPALRKYKKTAQFRRVANSAEWIIVQDLMSKIKLNASWATPSESAPLELSSPQSAPALMDIPASDSSVDMSPSTKAVALPQVPVDKFGFPTVFCLKRLRAPSTSSSLQSLTSVASTIDYGDIAAPQNDSSTPQVDAFGFPVFGDECGDIATPKAK